MFISTAFLCLLALFHFALYVVGIKWQNKQTETGILSPFEERTSDIERNCFLGERRNMEFRKKTTIVFKWMNKREKN